MDHINLKASLLAIALFIFTYKYYVKRAGSILSVGTAIALWAITIAVYFAHFFVIRSMAYIMVHYSYPSLALYVAWPLLTLTFLVWLPYALIHIKPFGLSADFFAQVIHFFSKHGFYIAICSVAIGLLVSFPKSTNHGPNPYLLQQNLLWLGAIIIVFLLSVFICYQIKLIRQPKPNIRLETYVKLGETSGHRHHKITPLPTIDTYSVSQPYFIPEKKEVVIVTYYDGNNRQLSVASVYRIDSNGNLIDQISQSELTRNDYGFYPVLFMDGILTDPKAQQCITWVFDSNQTKQPAAHTVSTIDFKLEAMQQDQNKLKLVHFQKTSTFICNNHKEVKYNGNNYYELTVENEVLKIKIDSVFSDQVRNAENCMEKQLEYFASPALNFSLLRLNGCRYYVVGKKGC